MTGPILAAGDALSRGDRHGHGNHSRAGRAEQLFRPWEGAGEQIPAASGSTIPAGMSHQDTAFTGTGASLPTWASELTLGSLAERERNFLVWSYLTSWRN